MFEGDLYTGDNDTEPSEPYDYRMEALLEFLDSPGGLVQLGILCATGQVTSGEASQLLGKINIEDPKFQEIGLILIATKLGRSEAGSN